MMSLAAINQRMSTLKDWSLEMDSIIKEISFSNFKEALAFVNKIQELTDKHEHHPDILISFNKVRLSLTTHEEKGLTSKDFDMAEDIDKIQ